MLSREDAILVLEKLSPEEQWQHTARMEAASAPPLTDKQRARLGPILNGKS